MLRALASAGIFTETEPGRFGLNEAGELLRTEAPRSLRNLALHYGGISFRAWEDVLYSVETGKPAFDHVYGTTVWDYLGQHPEEAAAFNGAMRQGAEARAETLARYPWKGTETVVDLAGGDGTLLIELLSRHPGASRRPRRSPARRHRGGGPHREGRAGGTLLGGGRRCAR